MTKLIIFDYDDTLVKSSTALYDADSKTAESMGLSKPNLKKYFSLWGKPHDEMILLLHPHVNLNEYKQKYGEIYDPAKLLVFKDTLNILEKVKNREYLMAILSAKKNAFLEEHLTKNNLRKYFKYIHSAESSKYHKPDPRVFDDILDYFKISPEEVIYIGDQIKDYEAAKKKGIRFIAVTTGVNTAKEFENLGCTEIVSSLSKLENILP